MRNRWETLSPVIPGWLRTPVVVGLLLASGGHVRADHAGYALRFDGVSDFVRLAETANIMGPGWQTTKTVSMWVKPMGTAFCSGPAVASCDAIFGDRSRWWGISRGVINGADRIWVWNYDGALRTIAIDYAVGEWTHIAMVHEAGTLSAYKDGILVGSVISGATLQPNTGALPVLHIGGIINNATRNWTFGGEIDEVQIWSIARSVQELNQDMVAPLEGTEFGLAAYYRMSDGAGTSLTDDSGHGWTGTLHDGNNAVPADGPIEWISSNAYGDDDGGGTPGNSPPVAVGQTVVTVEDTAVAITLTGYDADGDALSFQVTGQPTRGTLSGAAPNLIYVPLANYAGTDGFTFVVHDGDDQSAPSSVALTIAPINDPPTANDDSAVTSVETGVTVAVLVNDIDVDNGDDVTVVGAGPASNGTVMHDTTNVTYIPNSGFSGTDIFTYPICLPHKPDSRPLRRLAHIPECSRKRPPPDWRDP